MNDFDEFDAFEGATRPSLSQQAMAARPTRYLDGLNPAQREAVEQINGPVLMLAGAGTGKTKALTTRIVHLLNTGIARPNEILSVTFTNKAAREMKNRVGNMIGQVEGMPWMGTFHSICVKLLRRHAELVGLKSNFTILDTDDQIRLLKQLISAANIDEKRWPARQLSGLIDGWKNRALTPTKVPSADASAFNFMGTELYEQYQIRLRELNACDFGDLLLHMVTIFQSRVDVLEQYQRWFKYIMVDEYQDTNVAQYLWLRLLAQGHQNICCVGDDDQSIYGWRGAEVGNILRFEKDFPGAKVVRLEQNYRSTHHILAAASGVIDGNEGRLGKTLWTDKTEGEKVRLIGHWDGEEEARWIGDEIEASQNGTRGQRPMGLEDTAILVRASHQMRAFEDRFLTIGLPYRVIGGPRFYERMEIRDAMAYFRIAVSTEDDLAFERVVNTPKRGLGPKAIETIRLAGRSGTPLLDRASNVIQSKGVRGKALSELGTFVDFARLWNFLNSNVGNENLIVDYKTQIFETENTIADLKKHASFLSEELSANELELSLISEDQEKLRAAIRAIQLKISDINEEVSSLMSWVERLNKYIRIVSGDHFELAQMILDDSGYTEHWQNDKTPEGPGRLENLKELVKALEEFENLQGFLEHVSLVMDNDKDADGAKVSIMTLHGAKGLEFPQVFLPGWEDGLFPSQRSMDETGLKGLEEERRLAYVGITRAEEVCTISFAANRRVFGQWQSSMPSRFIDELPADHVDVLTPPGLYGGGFGAAGMAATASPAAQGMAQSDIFEKAASADVYNSPGWRRLQSRSQNRGMSQPSEAKNMTIDMNASSTFTVGDRVFHKKFGYGEIMEIEGDKLEVEFDKAGSKNLVSKFVMPAESADDIPF